MRSHAFRGVCRGGLVTWACVSLVACGAPSLGGDGGDAHGGPDVRDAGALDGAQSGMDAADDVPSPPLDGSGDDATPGDDAAPSDDGASNDGASGDAGDPYLPRRQRCEFRAGARVAATLGVTAAARAAIPIDHVIVLMNENRSFDHMFGAMMRTRPEVDGTPAGYTNPIPGGGTAAPAHATTTCISPDTPHNWDAMHAEWNGGHNDGFYAEAARQATGDPHRVLRFNNATDLPFYYWLYSTFAMSDRFFSSVLGPTWPNRDYLYAATSDGVRNTGERAIHVRNIFDALDAASVRWAVFADGGHTRQDCIGLADGRPGVYPTSTLYDQLTRGTLPPVSFIDPVGASQDEHPAGDVQAGEAWTRRIVNAVMASPLWPRTALIVTYDEAGGFFEHVPPPPACVPSTNVADAQFNRMGFRVPIVVVSPWARPGYVSHVVHETASVTRFIELLHDLPALTNRDANVDALLDMFDFTTPRLMRVPGTPPAAGTGGCP